MSTPEPAPHDSSGEATTAADTAAMERQANTGAATFPSERRGAAPEGSSRFAVLPSPIFVLLVGMTVLAGALSWNRTETEWFPGDAVYAPFVFMMGGWLVCLALHEFGHALVAWSCGERALRGSGYLRLNPFRFSEGFANLLLPVVIVLLGGFGMTGPTAYLDRTAVAGRLRRSAVALAGPLVSLALAVALWAGVKALIPDGFTTDNWAIAGLIYLCFLNLTAALVSLLPLPGLDGFNAIAPYLPQRAAAWAQARPTAIFGTVAVFAVLWFPPVHTALLSLMFSLMELLGINQNYVGFAQALFQFWVG
ncbi:site-2 protease family protein [Salinactinospora qingdaonensis]|uniref:Site-2 protease family protein n=1 Tax=Salinactinospora qingdaonensis TaxID=702744 RepID=A0ABP7FQE1_9ACTN